MAPAGPAEPGAPSRTDRGEQAPAAPTRLLRHATHRLDHAVGGAARRRVIVVLAAVLALDSADVASVGAAATQLEAGLDIGGTQIGLLLGVSGLVGALATVPAGVLTDRVKRTRMLSWAVASWAVAMALSGAATGFAFLLVTRLALGGVTAFAGPVTASLIGDYFPETERGRIYGYVLSGELIGAGFGFVVAGQFAALSWRAPFFALVVPTALVWWLIRHLAEPERGGASRLVADGPTGASADTTDVVHRLAQQAAVEPRASAVLTADPTGMALPRAVGYVLRVRSNLVLIIASALGYFFFSGLRGFAVEFAKRHYHIPQSAATSLTLVLGIGALVGVLAGGRLADALLARRRVAARVEVAGTAVLLAAALFVPALVTSQLWVALPLLILAALCLGATNPPLDAARLDIIHPRMWGRAEGVRSVLQNGADAAAPVLFGFLSASVFVGAAGLEYTFLLMLVALLAAGLVVLLVGRRTYPQDVAAAARSVELIGAPVASPGRS